MANQDTNTNTDAMTADDVFAVIDHIRSGDHGNELTTDRLCNYMEANIDEFMECYNNQDNGE